jgi:hypothetical protein
LLDILQRIPPLAGHPVNTANTAGEGRHPCPARRRLARPATGWDSSPALPGAEAGSAPETTSNDNRKPKVAPMPVVLDPDCRRCLQGVPGRRPPRLRDPDRTGSPRLLRAGPLRHQPLAAELARVAALGDPGRRTAKSPPASTCRRIRAFRTGCRRRWCSSMAAAGVIGDLDLPRRRLPTARRFRRADRDLGRLPPRARAQVSRRRR